MSPRSSPTHALLLMQCWLDWMPLSGNAAESYIKCVYMFRVCMCVSIRGKNGRAVSSYRKQTERKTKMGTAIELNTVYFDVTFVFDYCPCWDFVVKTFSPSRLSMVPRSAHNSKENRHVILSWAWMFNIGNKRSDTTDTCNTRQSDCCVNIEICCNIYWLQVYGINNIAGNTNGLIYNAQRQISPLRRLLLCWSSKVALALSQMVWHLNTRVLAKRTKPYHTYRAKNKQFVREESKT